MTNTRCCGLGGLLFGHKFRPRFDTSYTYPDDVAQRAEAAVAGVTKSPQAVLLDNDVQAIRAIRDTFTEFYSREDFYQRDICERCGQAIDRMPDPIEQMDTEELLTTAAERMKESDPFARAQLAQPIAELAALVPPSAQNRPEEETTGIKKIACPQCFHVHTDEDSKCPKCGHEHRS